MPDAPSVMIVGPVTWDVFPDGRRTAGGTVSFAARVASAMGIHAYVLTMAAPDADLSALEGHDVHVVSAPHTLTFAHTFAPDGFRTLRRLAEPGVSLVPGHAPPGWPAPDVLLLAPLMAAQVDGKSFAALPVAECGITAQGFLREADASGLVGTAGAPTRALLDAATSRASVFVSEDEIAKWPPDDVTALARQSRRLVITHGGRGAEIRDAAGSRYVPPTPAHAVDTTGAGDVFAAAFILALGEGEATAARLAAAYAAAKVEVIGPAPLPDRATIEQRLSDGRGDA